MLQNIIVTRTALFVCCLFRVCFVVLFCVQFYDDCEDDVMIEVTFMVLQSCGDSGDGVSHRLEFKFNYTAYG